MHAQLQMHNTTFGKRSKTTIPVISYGKSTKNYHAYIIKGLHLNTSPLYMLRTDNISIEYSSKLQNVLSYRGTRVYELIKVQYKTTSYFFPSHFLFNID